MKTRLSVLSAFMGALFLSFAGGVAPVKAADVVLYSYGLPPYTFDNKGEISGPAAKLVAELTKAAGLPEKATSVPVARLLATVAEGNGIGFPLARNAEREPKYKWIVKIYEDSFAFATLAPNKPVNTLEEAKALGSITVNNAGAPLNLLTKAGFTNLDQANSEAQNASKLFAGHVPAWFSVASGFRPIARTVKQDPTKLVVGAPVHKIEVYLIGSPNLPDDTVKKIQTRFEAMKASGEYDAIMKGATD